MRLGPGPAKSDMPTAVGYNNHTVIKQRLPMYSMGKRLYTQPHSDGPGPAKFYIENQTRYGTKSYQTYMGIRLQNPRNYLLIFIKYVIHWAFL